MWFPVLPGARSARSVASYAVGVGHRTEVGSVDVVDVSMSGNIWPVVGEDVLAVGIPFNLEAAVPSCSLESEVDAADPGEERSEGGHVTSPDQPRPTRLA
jgi:hypothetical protein